MKTALYPGSFDPITYGHIDIIKRAAEIFDNLTVSVLDNRSKSCLFSVDERVNMIKTVLKDIPNLQVISYEGLLVDCAKENNIGVIIRGLRAVTDFEYELQMSQMNRKLSNHYVETVYLNTSLKYSYLSSSTVKEVASFGGDISQMVPDNIEKLIYDRFERSKDDEQ